MAREKILAMVLAGGEGTRLAPLTAERSKPAVPFGGRYRIVDFVLSNLVNSGVHSIYLLVQYKSQSLIEHINRAWTVGPVIPEQFIDRTRHRPDTFFGDGLVAHVSFADPVCPELAGALADAAAAAGLSARRGGTYVCMEGPQFSTRAESLLYRSWGADVIGMTNLTEAKLAREAEICYATLALVTDYDAWREKGEAVSVEAVLAVLRENAAAARRTMREAVVRVKAHRGCPCRSALAFAIITDRSKIPEEARRRLAPLVGKYL